MNEKIKLKFEVEYEMANYMNQVFVFNGTGSVFPAAIFTDLEKAKAWIEKYNLNGIVNVYPLNIGLYDWAVDNEVLKIKSEHQTRNSFIEKFIEHYHFENGKII